MQPVRIEKERIGRFRQGITAMCTAFRVETHRPELAIGKLQETNPSKVLQVRFDEHSLSER